jgi:hypothetical protein
MPMIKSQEYEVLMYLNPSLCPNWYKGVKALEAAKNIDLAIKDVPCVTEISGEKSLVNIEAVRELI